MPLSCDPSETFPVSLITDLAKPEAERPTFLARFVTRREAKRIASLEEQACDPNLKDNQKAEALLDEALGILYVGWKNLTDREAKPVEFHRDEKGIVNFDEVIDLVDKYELLDLGTEGAIKLHLEKKRRLASQRASAGENSATAILPAESNASASSPPDKPMESTSGV